MLLPSVNLSDPEIVCETLLAGANAMRSYRGRKGCSHHIPQVGNIVVSGDLHDNPFNLTKIIKLASLDIPTNHVVLQELIHSNNNSSGIDLSYRMLVRVAGLVLTHPSQVHPILANHELSQVTLRPIAKGGGDMVEMFCRGVEQVFYRSADLVLEAIKTFVFAMPLAVRSASGLMCCHSLPDEKCMNHFDTTVIDRELDTTDYDTNTGSVYNMVWGRQYTQKQVRTLADHWGVKLFCLGHAWVPSGIEAAWSNMVRLNSDHGRGVALPLDLQTIQNATQAIKSAVELASITIDPRELSP